MTKTKDRITSKEVMEAIKKYITDEDDFLKIKNAYLFAKEKHAGQVRKTGEDYISHPLNVVKILTGVYADVPTLEAAFLHDILEQDCNCTADDLEREFGREVTSLVLGVTKLSNIHFSTENEYLIDYYKKIIVGMSEDVRVIIIKLADSLHNMRTLWALPKERQKAKANEALEILAPIADHLGIHKIKSELEDLALRYLKGEVFYDIAEKLNKSKLERNATVNEMLQEVSNLLNKHEINHEIKGRAKSIYSIYNKLNKGKKFSDIYDLLALRIIVNTEQECYLALGIIHSKFRPLPKRFKDYIAMPKPNMYQSLHTTVFGIDGYLFEIQIRTHEMDEVAENGIASHWAYKEQRDAKEAMKSTTEQKLQFFKAIMELSNEKLSNEEFVNSVKEEVLNNNIYVFTPKGDVIELPRGATPIDFAYKVHSKVGETTVGAIVNNCIVPLNYELQNNDIVKINTNKNSTPSKEWINFVKTAGARNRIKSFFTKNEREVYIERGKYLTEKALRKKKIPFNELFSPENTKIIFDELKIKKLDDLYLNIGNGKTSINTVIHIIYKPEEKIVKKKAPVKIDNNADIIVSGIDNVKVSLANCCNPIFGDDIIGYITKGSGITVHRSNCHNLATLDDRTIEVSWNEKSAKKYVSNLIIYSNTRDNNMVDLVQKISMQDINIERINMVFQREVAVYEVTIYVSGLKQLNNLLLQLDKISYIDKVERLIR